MDQKMEQHNDPTTPELDRTACALLAMAEHFRTMRSPKYKMAIKCVKACFKTPMSREMNTIVHFELGKLYFYYTENLDIAKYNLDLAVIL
ncbi:hypothetical protein AB6A40_009835 [Gnathostoma spinigerum]|uniref:Cohesin loading complex subunit SCC4 homolog n=1 Tax=Gnathostoma spinigerum TaxID=75299 RepID=A0ABD6EZX3_9BILA